MDGEVGKKWAFTRLYNPHREIMIKMKYYKLVVFHFVVLLTCPQVLWKFLCFQCNTLGKYVIYLILCLFVDDFDNQYDKNVDAQVICISK